MEKPLGKSFNEIYSLLNGNYVLIVTATELETKNLHQHLVPLANYEGLIEIHEGNLTYYVGVLGKYAVVHVQSVMGSIGKSSSLMTISEAIRLWENKITIMIGIAFGIDKREQSIGDVLVSEAVIPYDNKKVAKKETIQRGLPETASKYLISRFRSAKYWEHKLEKGNAKMIIAPILSGEELIDNKERLLELIGLNPNVKGGEMEGAGLISACDSLCDWIIVKGICDYADGNKKKNKIKNQTIAINSAVSLCLEIFNSDYAFKEKNIFPYTLPNTNPEQYKLINQVLFEVYKPESDSYYLLRGIDTVVAGYLNMYNVWLSGASGTGKSTIIRRYIAKKNEQAIHVVLAACDGNTNDFFKEIFYQVVAKLDPDTKYELPDNAHEVLRQMIKVIEQKSLAKNITIFIDEIPIGNGEKYKLFVEKITGLIIANRSDKVDIKYIFTSIYSAKPYITNEQKRVHEFVQFIDINPWENKEIENLINIITTSINLKLSDNEVSEITNSSNGSPRFVKKVFKNLFSTDIRERKSIREILNDTQGDLS